MRFISFLILFTLCVGCSSETPPVYTVLQGKLPAGSEKARVNPGGDWRALSLNEDSTFLDTLELSVPGYVDLVLDEFEFWIYLAPGDEVDIDATDSIPVFGGSTPEVNAYLYQDVLDGRRQYSDNERVFSLNESDYVSYRDSIKADKLNRLAQLPAGTEAFQDFHLKAINYEYQYDVARYPMYHSYYFEDYEPTEIITDFYKNVSLANEQDAQRYGNYRQLANLIIDKRADSLVEAGLSPLAAKLAVLKGVGSTKLLEGQLRNSLYLFNANEADMEGMRDNLLALAQTEETKEIITKHYAVISQLKPGSPSPAFDYENHAGGKTRLAALKGKHVYIDVWATWCGPCIREIPHLKELEAAFHGADIEFVSISIDKPEAHQKWNEMVKARQLGGIQLFADDSWESDFIRSYGIRGIPRFILLDDEGNIVTADAERPSDPKTKERLQALVLR